MGERRKLPDDSETREMAVPDFAGGRLFRSTSICLPCG